MKPARDLTRTVFRLRNLPSRICSPNEVADLLSAALHLSAHQVIVYSIAKTLNKWEKQPSRVATLQLKAVPTCLQNAMDDDEWVIVLQGGHPPWDVLILDTHFRGMTALTDVDPARHRADCIAVSGLASHPFGSWQPRGHDKTFMWVRDAIPASIPGLRTIIYGYDSSLLESSSFQSISDLAQSLILHLKSGGWNLPSSKPIVFLAHSLGGLVLKEAIVQAASGEKNITNILDNVLGAIMFGVPSLGMEQSHLMAMVEGQPNEFLVQDLSREGGSNYVRQLHAQFEGLSFLRKAYILWAYETKVSSTVVRRSDGTWARTGRPTVLVNPESATSHNYRTNKSLTIPINEDHSNMVKFPRDDANLRLILHSLSEICSPNRPVEPVGNGSDNEIGRRDTLGTVPVSISDSTQKDWLPIGSSMSCEGEDALTKLGQLFASMTDLHRELHTPELDFRIDQIDDPFENTFKWVFDVPSFSGWLQEGSELFWINGKPGSGKSTIMKLIYKSKETWELLHNWNTGSLEVKAGFFFHYRGSAIQKSFEGVLRSLILQLLAPYRNMYRKNHEQTWEEYQALKSAQRKIDQQMYGIRASLESTRREIENIREEIGILSQRGDELSDVQRAANLDKCRRRLPLLQSRHTELSRRLAEMTPQWMTELASLRTSITSVATRFKPYSTQPMTKFLTKAMAEFHDERDGLIPRLERVLRILLDQNATRTDLILFFDALDEFDGHLDLISRFLKGLIQRSPSSMTAVKICFSSRPWEPLRKQFSSYPGFALQDYTRNDMEEFAAGSITKSDTTNPYITQLIPGIIARANGVFLWVKLALKVLFETVMYSPNAVSPELLESKLLGLPDDLFEFYELIIYRISRSNRRRTFALLELLIRHSGPPVTAIQIRDAVLVSSCNSYQEAMDALRQGHPESGNGSLPLPNLSYPSDSEKQARKDIAAWGGGLVEIKRQDNIDRPQLMHQTVLEFTTNLTFKRIVVGDLACLVNENGHSFHLKYWSLSKRWARDNFMAIGGMQNNHDRAPRHQAYHSQDEELQHLAYHAEQSELTTGMSHFDYLYSIPFLDPYGLEESWNRDEVFVFLVASCGLTLCLRDWLARIAPDGFTTMNKPLLTSFPLLQALVFAPPWGVFFERYMTTIRLLLENGYPVNDEHNFLTLLYKETWRNRQHTYPKRISDSTLLKLATLALEAGASANLLLGLFGEDSRFVCNAWPLHIVPPSLASEMIRHGANPNALDDANRTPLDWVVSFPSNGLNKPVDWDGVGRYEMCQILVKAGGTPSQSTLESKAWADMLAEFEKEGYDTQMIRQRVQPPGPVEPVGGLLVEPPVPGPIEEDCADEEELETRGGAAESGGRLEEGKRRKSRRHREFSLWCFR
ncbi:hypothetical protein CHGG_05617 [Chaetomium globosum CBS 148.51]|uniref:Nephrocystin 3-like N-terminal domain-containing protein n=1 Tax=Chaetomium globosum (strain ATCC 6205 / CBS 148.51 / DSM 1962 / NBRC 6347 / NRRL 1970) TaxID=306901 RepID=Q2H6U8_CHAGB|nr:uncharacterized protein CHGG_05617 [Chaetomium globosum CBS 148.51]EAQ88998.1 hypothetical protein CHGG_05617 [Chaetomium globosum CBS 148.51]